MLLGIDIGTSKVAAVIVDTDRRVLAAVSAPHVADRPASPGRAEQDADALVAAACAAVRELPADLRRQVRAIGTTGQMHGVVLLDHSGHPVTPLITWQDQRCTETPAFLEQLSARTGHRLRSGFGCATLSWLGQQRLLPREAVTASTIHDLLVARLCEQARPQTDPTDAASWGLFDLPKRCWDEQAVAAAGIPDALLPAVRPCGAEAGQLAGATGGSLGLPPGIPVAIAIGDNQASLLASLREPEKELALTLGTGGQASVVLPPGAAIDWRLALSPEARCEYRPYPGERFAVVAASLCGGAAWAWLADVVCRWAADLGLPAPDRSRVFNMLNELAATATAELVVAPHFMGERHDPSLRGCIAGIDLGNFRLGPLARGLARGIMGNLRGMLPPEALEGRSRLVGSGNALRRNPLLQEMAAEVFGLPLVLNEGQEEAATGAALNACGLVG